MNSFEDPKEQVKAILRERRKKELHWYALFVQGNHERAIAKALLDRESDNLALPTRMQKPPVVDKVFVPIKQEKRKWSDRTKVVDVVLTTGLIFIRMKLEMQRDLYISPFIKHFLYDRDEHTPAVIPDEQMEAFISIAGKVEDISVGVPEVGDKVRVLCGPYEGMTGFLIRKDNTARFQLRLCHNLAFQININEADVARVAPDAEDIIPDVRYK